MHPEYEHVLRTIHTALCSVRLETVVEVEGPNKLGGFRLTDGPHRSGLSRLPGGRWCVSGWQDVEDGAETAFGPGAARRWQREQVIGLTPNLSEAVVTAIEVLVEARIRDAWKQTPADAPQHEAARQSADAGAGRPSVFRTARARRGRNAHKAAGQ